jgi:hypothetical protein
MRTKFAIGRDYSDEKQAKASFALLRLQAAMKHAWSRDCASVKRLSTQVVVNTRRKNSSSMIVTLRANHQRRLPRV